MYFAKTGLPQKCTGMSQAGLQDFISETDRLESLIEDATRAFTSNVVRPDLDGRGFPIGTAPGACDDPVASMGYVANPGPALARIGAPVPSFARVVPIDYPECLRDWTAPAPATAYSGRAGLGGLAGNAVAGTGKIVMTPAKALYSLGETATIVITGPPGWYVRQRNLWQGRSTGETAEGIRGWFVVPNEDGSNTIPASGNLIMHLKFGPHDVGEWQYEFEFATPDLTSEDQGRSEHGGLNYIPASQIQGDPLNFSVQGQLDIAPRLDYTAYFADKHVTEEYYRQFVAMYEGIPEAQVKVPNLVRATLISAADTADAQRQQAMANELNAARMFGYDEEVAKWAAAADYYGPHPHPIGYSPARIAAAINGDLSQLTQAERDFLIAKTNSIVSAVDGSTITMNRPLAYAPDGRKLTAAEFSASIPKTMTLTASSGGAAPVTNANLLAQIFSAMNNTPAGSSTPAPAAASSSAIAQTLNSYAPAILPASLKTEAAGLPVWVWALGGIGAVLALKK